MSANVQMVVSLNNLGLATIMASDIDNGSSDNCDIAEMTLSNYNFILNGLDQQGLIMECQEGGIQIEAGVG